MKALSKLFVPLLATIALASCGGGGGGSKSAFTPTPNDTIDISAATSVSTNSFTTLIVTVKKADGTVENDGTQVNASVSPSTIGTVSGSTGSAAGTTAANTLSGGKTSFSFTSSNQAGTATITISLPAGTNGSPSVATKSVGINVTAGNNQDPRLEVDAVATTLPLSPFTFATQQVTPFPGNFLGSPYVTPVTITWRHTNGQLVNSGTVNVSVAPPSIIQFSTGSGTQFQTLVGSGTVPVVAGIATLYIHSGNTPGPATLTVTATDPDNAQTISSQVVFNVAGAGTTLPASISFASGGAVYISGSGGPQSLVLTATVTDGSNALVPDPSGFDNVVFQIVGPANSDARLVGVNAAGQSVTGSSISTVTHNGVAAVTFESGTQQGPVQVKVTADRGDNNIDNGIQDPVSATTSVVVSDGKLYNLTLTIPGPNAGVLLVNGVSTDASATVLPVDPNGTYSLTISAKGEDRQGNPVLPGTQIRFGEIDGPLNGLTGTNRGQFAISGNDGNPAEGTTLFTAPTGAFTTAGGGAGPGDTLLVFGKQVTGNRDLENARTVRTINSATSLNTTIAFNRNDDTGVSVDYGPVLPYVIGRGLDGSIPPSAATNADGVATVKLTYPVSKLGKLAAVWAQGNGIVTNGATKTVDDIMFVRFAGVAAIGDLAAAVTASPNPIAGNTTQIVTVCIADALGSPIQGVQFNFAYSGTGTAKVDNTPQTGLLANLTDSSGCAPATVVSTGVQPGTDGGGVLKFCAGSLCASVNVVVNVVCQVKPGSVTVSSAGLTGSITITAFDSLGNPAAGIEISGVCSASGGDGATISPPVFTGLTNAQGVTVDIFTAQHFVKLGTATTDPSAGVGSCVYSAGDKVCATVPFTGLANGCDFSPLPPSCN